MTINREFQEIRDVYRALCYLEIFFYSEAIRPRVVPDVRQYLVDLATRYPYIVPDKNIFLF